MTPNDETPAATLTRYGFLARWLHWTMAALIMALFALGAMITGVLNHFPAVLHWHQSLGLCALLLACARIINRLIHRPPAWLDSYGPYARRAAVISERAIYLLLVLQPLVGWALVSASGIPTTLAGSIRLASIVPADLSLYGWLRATHGLLAYALLASVTFHMATIAFHQLAKRDGLLARMLPGKRAR